jgi:hypothetical protein
MDLSVVSMGMSCLLMACELLNCCEIVPQQVFEYDEDKESLFEVCFILINLVETNTESILDLADLHSSSSGEYSSSIIDYHRYCAEYLTKKNAIEQSSECTYVLIYNKKILIFNKLKNMKLVCFLKFKGFEYSIFEKIFLIM